MTMRLPHILGLSDFAGGVGSLSVSWHHPASLILGLVLLMPAAWMIARLHAARFPHLAVLPRRVLTACRIAVLLLLVLILSGPHVRSEEKAPQLPVLIVLIDESASMSLPVTFAAKNAETPAMGSANQTRIQLVDEVLVQERASLFQPLSKRFDLRTYRFARSIRRTDLATPVEPADREQMQDTALGPALQHATSDAGRNLIAGIVLFSDGGSTTGADPLVVASEIGKGSAAAPIFAVPVGSSAPVPDVALVEVLAPPVVARNDVAMLVATIRSTGVPSQVVQVRLLEGDRELEMTRLTLTAQQTQQVQLAFRQTQDTGPRSLRVVVDRLKEDQVPQNNTRDVHLRVDDQRRRVLFLEGAPRWDFRFLDHAMRRDQGLDATVIMESQLRASGVAGIDLPAAAGLPVDAARFAEFAVVMLGDVSPDLLPASLQSQLAAAVKEKGVGLIVLAGTQSMPQRFLEGPLADLLPVNVRPGRARAAASMAEDLLIDGVEAEPFAPFRMEVTALGAGHPVFTLYDQPSRNRANWNQMPPFYWAAATLDARPAATVLARITVNSQSLPLIAEQTAGRGRVLFVGTDSTYLWRRQVGDQYFNRFWGQAIRHVAQPAGRAVDASWIDLQPQVAAPGERVNLELHAFDGNKQPLTEESLTMQVVHRTSSKGVDSLTMTRTSVAGIYRGSWQAGDVGEYEFRSAHSSAPVSALIRVSGSGDELLHPGVDRVLLESLAQRTGGKLLELDALSTLPTLLPRIAGIGGPVHEEDLWDNWVVLLLLTTLYCVDVGIRRWTGLT